MALMRIRSLRDGFRRCGVVHSSQWVVHEDTAFTDEQWEIIKAEPMLVVERCPKGFKAFITNLNVSSENLLKAALDTDALIAMEQQKNMDAVDEAAMSAEQAS